MSAPHGSIPGYRPGPILSGPKKAFLASLAITPVVAYVYLRNKQNQEEDAQRLLEEEGRKNWLAGDKRATGDLSVSVNRSGGGV